MRPTREHPVLGKLEYVNQNGQWWQSQVRVSGQLVRLDFHPPSGVRLTNEDLVTGTILFEWIRDNEARLRDNAFADLRKQPDISGALTASLARPYMIWLWDDHADVMYEYDDFTENAPLKGLQIEISVKEGQLAGKSGTRWMRYDERCENLLKRPLPPGLEWFVDSLPDQFIATVAAWLTIKLDSAELRDLLREAQTEVADALSKADGEVRLYLLAAQSLLKEIGDEVDAQASS
jgi:hypothetical protein